MSVLGVDVHAFGIGHDVFSTVAVLSQEDTFARLGTSVCLGNHNFRDSSLHESVQKGLHFMQIGVDIAIQKQFHFFAYVVYLEQYGQRKRSAVDYFHYIVSRQVLFDKRI